jgi:XTP/dITP diphosphohydrolase
VVEKLCIASTNKGKIRELKQILSSYFELHWLGDFGPIPEAEEPFESFLENAQAKAKHYTEFTKMLTLSEDAGLCIHPLNNFPGIHSKRFIEESGGLWNAFDRLEQMLSAVDGEEHGATFISVSVICDPQIGRAHV